MSKERDLLIKACVFLDSHVENDCGLISEIRSLLSQPNEEKLTMQQRLEEYKKGYARAEQDLKREPSMTGREMYQRGYAAAERDLKREPLSDKVICEILLKKEWFGFVQLVRNIEKAHGIGGEL
jgi:hypothetical protein